MSKRDWSDRTFVLQKVKQFEWNFQYADESLKKDRQFVLESVKQNPFVLEYVDESFQRDREIVLLAVKNNGRALQYASESFKKDREIVREAIKQNEYAKNHVDKSLKQDRAFVYSLFKQNESLAKSFSPFLTEQIEKWNGIIKKLANGNIIERFSNNFLDENDLYYCIEQGLMFNAKSQSSIFNFNPAYSSNFVEKLIIFQILKQMNDEELSNNFNYLETANFYLFCFRLDKFLDDNMIQPVRMRDLKSYVENLVQNFKTNLYSKKEIKEIVLFAEKWFDNKENFDNYKQILTKYNELRGDLSKVFRALNYYYNYFSNDYDFISILGYGGEGVVFKVFHKKTDSVRALKLKYEPEQSVESGSKTITLLKRDEIEGKIKFFDCGIIQNHLYSVMEIGEESLSNYISRNNENGIYGDEFIKKENLHEILEIFIGVLNSVQSIHNHNILHRDLDPNNIVKVQDSYKIIDFETSRVVKKGNSITIGLGKYSYMSPEISHESYTDDEFKNGDNEKLAHNINITTSCDIFSLGCIFLKLLTNCPLQLDQQFISDPDISKYGNNYLYFTGYGKYFYTVVTTTEGEMKLHYAIQKLINKSIDPQLEVNEILIRSIITMIQRDSTKRLDCYSHKIILENILKYLKGEIVDFSSNIKNQMSGMKEITPLRSYSQIVDENTKLFEQNEKLTKENINLLERIKLLEQELSTKH